MITEALSFIPPYDRDTWVRAAMAIKSELGDSGFQIWDDWSRQADNYRERDARAVWRSVKPWGGITIVSLYAEARRYGWGGEDRRIVVDREAIQRQRDMEQAREQRRHESAAKKAQRMIMDARPEHHDYLNAKGFPNRQGLVLNDDLLVPMRCARKGTLTGLQTIKPWGEKKFLTGTRAKGAVFVIGQGSETYLCEGYATGLSIVDALHALYRQGRVVVTFSAGNLAHVAGMLRGKRYVIADNDESDTGARYAKLTGLPWWMPPETGDANDYHQGAGIRALAKAINGLRCIH